MGASLVRICTKSSHPWGAPTWALSRLAKAMPVIESTLAAAREAFRASGG